MNHGNHWILGSFAIVEAVAVVVLLIMAPQSGVEWNSDTATGGSSSSGASAHLTANADSSISSGNTSTGSSEEHGSASQLSAQWGSQQCTYDFTFKPTSQKFWTPVILLNAPFGGSASASSTMAVTGEYQVAAFGYTAGYSTTSTHGWTITVPGGESAGVFELDTWTMHHYVNVSAPWGGWSCAQNWVASITAKSNDFASKYTQTIPSAVTSPATQLTIQDTVSRAYYTTVVMDQAFAVDNDGAFQDCGGPGTTVTLTNSQISYSGIDVSMSVTYGNQATVATSLLSFDMSIQNSDGHFTSFSYTYPDNGGAWLQDSLTNANPLLPPGALAFFWIPCNAIAGGGGCVATGTQILMATGTTEAVQHLNPGDRIRGYSWATGNYTNETVAYVNSSTQNSLVKINGALVVTSVNQPLFISNLTYLGWMLDPRNLTVGDFMFDPINFDWVKITTLSTVTTNTLVYDVRVNTGFFDFITWQSSSWTLAAEKAEYGGTD